MANSSTLALPTVPKKDVDDKDIRRVQTPTLVAANDTQINTYGKSLMREQLAGKNYEFDAIVADVVTPIIGMDFLTTKGNDLRINPSARCLERIEPNLCGGCHIVSNVNKEPTDTELGQFRETATLIMQDHLDNVGRNLNDVKPLMEPFRITIKPGAKPAFSKCRPQHGEKK